MLRYKHANQHSPKWKDFNWNNWIPCFITSKLKSKQMTTHQPCQDNVNTWIQIMHTCCGNAQISNPSTASFTRLSVGCWDINPEILSDLGDQCIVSVLLVTGDIDWNWKQILFKKLGKSLTFRVRGRGGGCSIVYRNTIWHQTSLVLFRFFFSCDSFRRDSIVLHSQNGQIKIVKKIK